MTKKWEYMTLNADRSALDNYRPSFMDEARAAGERGWEAVCVIQSLTAAGEQAVNQVLFKRPIDEEIAYEQQG